MKNIEWEKLREEQHQFGYRKMLKRYYRMPNGDEACFDLTDPGNIVSILPFTEDGHIIVTAQYRPGPERIMYDLPGGFADDGETMEEAAIRELQEETGYTPGRIELLTTTYPDGYSTAKRHRFVAFDCVKTQDPQPDEHEFFDVRLMTMDEYRRHADAGESTDAESLYRYLLQHL